VSRDGSRFEEFTGRPLVEVAQVRLDERPVEVLTPGDADAWVTVPAFNEEGSLGATLDALRGQVLRPLVVVVVDNGSADGTAEVVRGEAAAFVAAGVGLRLVAEPERGTGAAADTGMRVAIAGGARYLLRTDADSLPRPDWAGRMEARLASGIDLVAGRVVAREDEHLGRGEYLTVAVLMKVGAFGAVIRNWRPGYRARFHLMTGSNCAIRADMYERVGGFPRARIDEVHDDRALMNRVRLVSDRVISDHEAIVASSARRYRSYGAAGVLRWYMRHETAGRPIDVR
jgi:glycosyltransferase involved in cell wall biosynthesis